MRELRRKIRVARMIDRRDPVLILAFWVVVLHGFIVLGYLTATVLGS